MAPTSAALTVRPMLFVVAGLVLGLAIAVGPLDFLLPYVGSVNVAVVEYGTKLTERVLREIGTIDEASTVVPLYAPIIGVALPGLVAIAMAYTLRASDKAKRFVTALCVLGAGLGFFVLDIVQAAIVFVVVIILSAVTNLLVGAAVRLPLALAGTVLAVTYGAQLLGGSDAALMQAAVMYHDAAGVGDIDLWRLLLTFTGIMPFGAALWIAVKD